MRMFLEIILKIFSKENVDQAIWCRKMGFKILVKKNPLQDNNKNHKGNNNILVNINLKNENQIKLPTL